MLQTVYIVNGNSNKLQAPKRCINYLFATVMTVTNNTNHSVAVADLTERIVMIRVYQSIKLMLKGEGPALFEFKELKSNLCTLFLFSDMSLSLLVM